MSRIEYGTSWAKVHNLPDPESHFAITQDDDYWSGAYAYTDMDGIRFAVQDEQDDEVTAYRHLSPAEARDLAAWLLAAAHHIRTEGTDR